MVHQIFAFINTVDKVNWPLQRKSKADVLNTIVSLETNFFIYSLLTWPEGKTYNSYDEKQTTITDDINTSDTSKASHETCYSDTFVRCDHHSVISLLKVRWPLSTLLTAM